MKKPEEMLKRGKGNFLHCTDYEDAIEAMKEYGKQCWEAACKAQMNKVFEHCTHSPQGTNGHAIKHWVKEVPFPSALAGN